MKIEIGKYYIWHASPALRGKYDLGERKPVLVRVLIPIIKFNTIKKKDAGFFIRLQVYKRAQRDGVTTWVKTQIVEIKDPILSPPHVRAAIEPD